jgi:hypothetical protein
MKRYIGTKIIHAEPSASNDGEDAKPGYKVVYADGYTSWSPKDVFEEAYRECEAMTFGLALECLKKGMHVCRAGWNGKGMWLELQRPDTHSKMTLPYVFLNYPADAQNTPGARVPWLASQTDMLAEDWKIVI